MRVLGQTNQSFLKFKDGNGRSHTLVIPPEVTTKVHTEEINNFICLEIAADMAYVS